LAIWLTLPGLGPNHLSLVVLNLWEIPHWWEMVELPSEVWPVGQ